MVDGGRILKGRDQRMPNQREGPSAGPRDEMQSPEIWTHFQSPPNAKVNTVTSCRQPVDDVSDNPLRLLPIVITTCCQTQQGDWHVAVFQDGAQARQEVRALGDDLAIYQWYTSFTHNAI
uniref:Uncharacterized protein n=1 Tax=Branchiostoma floridae TaxID=7739 RepID=C3YLD3_BRAFL|eukprot:XP_002602858.1 hypothetical protein BRAFLDRAFT_103243 [Branchiostoma floridae]